MMSSTLLTNYLLASNKAKLIFFLSAYFIICNFYTFDLDFIANCAANSTNQESTISTNDKLVQYFFSENVIKKQEEIINQQQKEIQNLTSLCIGITILFVFFSFK
jgi:hypothetical protein